MTSPNDWPEVSLGRLVRFGNGRDYKEVEDPDGPYPVIGSGGEFSRACDFLYEGESILFGRKGTIDRPRYINGRFWTVDTMYYTIPGALVVPRWLYYWATTIPFGMLATDTALPSMTSSALGALRLRLPRLSDQQTIADFLDRETAQIDAMIEAQRTLAVRLVERRSALIWQSVTKGVDDASHRPSAVEWIGDVPEHWQVNRLKTAIESVQSGVWGQESRGDATDIRCVRVADFDRARLGVAKGDTTLRSVPMSDQARFGLRCGDLLLEKSGGTGINPVGFMAMYDSDEPAVCSNFIGRVRLRARQHPRYWLYACAASYLYRLTHRSVKQTTGIQNLDIGSYFNEPFPFPPFKEQVQIAAWLDATTAQIDAVIAASKDAITLMQERRAALISAAVTGRIDPRTGKEVRLDDLALDLV